MHFNRSGIRFYLKWFESFYTVRFNSCHGTFESFLKQKLVGFSIISVRIISLKIPLSELKTWIKFKSDITYGLKGIALTGIF